MSQLPSAALSVAWSRREKREDEIRFVVQELNASGHAGIAFLEAEGDQMEINIIVMEPGVMSSRSVTPREWTGGCG
jgi:hypothetical protein